MQKSLKFTKRPRRFQESPKGMALNAIVLPRTDIMVLPNSANGISQEFLRLKELLVDRKYSLRRFGNIVRKEDEVAASEFFRCLKWQIALLEDCRHEVLHRLCLEAKRRRQGSI